MIRTPAIALAAVAFAAFAAPTGASAQESCQGMYSRLMGLYQTAPGSAEYAQMSNYYTSRCIAGAPAAVPYPQPYAYQPGYVDPGAAVLGAAIIGGAIAGSEHRDRDEWRERREWRERNEWRERGDRDERDWRR